jgi:hypothetical protein
MKTIGRSSPWLFVGILSLLPVVGGADGTGSCQGRLVPIGGDPKDSGGYAGGAGAGGQAGKAGSAGTQTAGSDPGTGGSSDGRDGACAQCTDPCAPFQAEAGDACEKVLGYKWNGSACVAVGGCVCRGDDCGRLYPDVNTCAAVHKGCVAVDPCADTANAIARLLAGNTKCTTDADCTFVSISCLAGTSCSGVHYVNVSFDQKQLAPLRAELNLCRNGDANAECPVCLILDPPPACNTGICGPGSLQIPDDPCAGKKCGEECNTCVPGKPCDLVLRFCDAKGVCGGTTQCQ